MSNVATHIEAVELAPICYYLTSVTKQIVVRIRDCAAHPQDRAAQLHDDYRAGRSG